MRSARNRGFGLVVLLLGLAVTTHAAPIRVGIFVGIGQGRYWHTNQHTAANAIASILALPDTAGLGPDLMTLPDGFVVSRFGLTGTATGAPGVALRQEFIDALDSLDVVILNSNTDPGNIFSAAPHRERLREFWSRKGFVSVHFTTDSYGTWGAWDSLHGTRFQNHPASDRSATVRLDTLAMVEPAWRMLNRSLADTSFVEEWLSFTTSGETIRATPGLKVLLDVDESTYNGGLGGAKAMGDHPMAWYRELPEGGRFFYTAVGHRANLYTGGSQPRFLRRQLYNAILWTAGYNEDGSRTATGIRDRKGAGDRSVILRTFWSGQALGVEVGRDGPHSVEVRTLEGRQVAARRGEGRAVHEFAELRSGAVYAVSVTSAGQRFARLVTTP